MSGRLRIGIDVAALRRPESGIGRYTESLVRALASGSDDEIRAFLAGPVSGPLPLPPAVRLSRMPLPRRALEWSWRTFAWPPVEFATGAIDVFHTSDWSHPPQRGGARVTTVHDLGPLDHPEWYAPSIVAAHRRQNRITAERAHRIIAVSDFTRERFLAHHDVDPARVVVVHSGVWTPADAPDPSSLEGLALPGRYLLYVGTAEARKNLPGLLRIFRHVAADESDLALVLAGAIDARSSAGVDGSGAWTLNPVEAAGLEEATLERVWGLGPVPRPVLQALYRQASALVFPTLYEGFGLPVLEAMAAGCPVVASDRSAVPEVVAEAGMIADPEDETGFAQAILSVVRDPARTAALQERGLERARSFTWDRAARETRAVYGAALEDVTGAPR